MTKVKWIVGGLCAVLLVAGCTGGTATAPPIVQPTPQIIYVTSSPIVIYVTPAPAAETASAAPVPSPEMHMVTGKLTLHSTTDVWAGGAPCEGKGAWTGLGPGAPVVARNATNVVIGSGLVGPGTATRTAGSGISLYNSSQCVFTYTVTVPRSDFYAIQFRSDAPFTISYADLAKAAWNLDLSVGP